MKEIKSINDLELLLKLPISTNDARQFLSSNEYRDDFLLYYMHFHDDGNEHVYKKWITENLSSNKNQIIEHVFSLAVYIDFYSQSVVTRGKEVLIGRYKELSKSACLDYMISQRKHISKATYIKIHEEALLHSRLIMVKFQTFFNLLPYKPEVAFKKIQIILRGTEFPTLFYRFVNQLDLLDSDLQKQAGEFIVNELKNKKFRKGVKSDLIRVIEEGYKQLKN